MDAQERLESNRKDLRYKNVSHVPTFKPDANIKYYDAGIAHLVATARRLILQLLKRKQYQDCLQLIVALITTSKYIPESYWQIGQEIFENISPEDLPLYLRSAISGIQQPKNIENIKAYLIYLKSHEKYTSMEDLMREFESTHEKYPEYCELYALFLFDEWQRNPTEPPNSALQDWLEKAYKGGCQNRHLIIAYLKLLDYKKDSDTKKKVVAECIEKCGKNDPELMSALVTTGHVDNWLPAAIHVCMTDPLADPQILLTKVLVLLKSVCEDSPRYSHCMLTRARLLVARLESGASDEITLEEGAQFAQEFQYMKEPKKIAEYINGGELRLALKRLPSDNEHVKQIMAILKKNRKRSQLSFDEMVSVEKKRKVQANKSNPWERFLLGRKKV